jgi:hypothetical protein
MANSETTREVEELLSSLNKELHKRKKGNQFEFLQQKLLRLIDITLAQNIGNARKKEIGNILPSNAAFLMKNSIHTDKIACGAEWNRIKIGKRKDLTSYYTKHQFLQKISDAIKNYHTDLVYNAKKTLYARMWTLNSEKFIDFIVIFSLSSLKEIVIQMAKEYLKETK